MSDATGQGTDDGMAPNILPLYELVADELGRRLGIRTELVVETD